MHVYRYSRGSVIEWRQGAAYSSGSGGSTGTAAPRQRWQIRTSRGAAFTWYVRGSGGAGPATPYITTKPYAGWNKATLPNTVIPFVKVINPADGTVALSLSNQTTASDATLTITDAALSSGTAYLVVSFNAAGTARGIDLYTAA